MITKHLIISGDVQGVGYRAWMVEKARQYGLHGWVRNCKNGTVEAILHGAQNKVALLINDAHEGPSMASIENIDVTDMDFYDGVPAFEQRLTE